MTQYTPAQLQDLWIRAGGNPQTAGRAAQAAYAKSGGNTEAPGGLWGLNATPGVDDVNSARTAVAMSNNGLDFPYPTVPGTIIPDGWAILGQLITGGGSDSAGTDIIGQLKFIVMMLFGFSLMVVGLLVMVLGSRPVKAIASFAGGSILSGAGFGIGANATAGKATRAAVAGGEEPPPEAQPVEPAPTPPKPSGSYFSPAPRGRKIRWGDTVEMPAVSEGGEALGPGHAPSIRRPKGPEPVRRSQRPVKIGDSMFQSRGKKGGRHRA